MVKHVTGDQSVSDALRLDSTRSKTEPKLRINFLEFRKKILIFLKIGRRNVIFSKFSLSSNLTWISEKSDQAKYHKKFLVKEHYLNISTHQKLLKSIEGARSTVNLNLFCK